MKQTNRRIDLEVEELTRRICFESKPLWERVWIKLKRACINYLFFEAVVVYIFFIAFVYCVLRVAVYFITPIYLK